MANRIPNNGENLSNEGFLSSIRKNAIPAVVMAALAATSGKAEAAWQCGNDVDNTPDGTPTGTTYNRTTGYGVVGERGGDVSFSNEDDGAGGVAINRGDGTTLTDITADIQSLDPSLAGKTLEANSYNNDTDELMIRNHDDDTYWVIDGITGSSPLAVELQGDVNGNGSIDVSTGSYIGSYYVNSTYRSDAYEYSSSSSPVAVYSRSGGYDSEIQADLDNDRLLMNDSAYDVFEVTDVSGVPVRTQIASLSDAMLASFTPAENSASGYDELMYTDSNTFEQYYCYDDVTAVATTVDADGDGSTSDVDCDDTNASVYPGAPTASDDGVDSDCDENADTPEISSLTVTPATTIAPGDAVSLRADVEMMKLTMQV
jgi:hypothetical protein